MRVNVTDLVMTNLGFAVLLKAADDPRTLPIFIGAPEAQSISIHLSQTQVPRPLTHYLMRSTISAMGGELLRVTVCSVRDGTFIAELLIRQDGEMVRVDARPSDAIALALRCEAPIYTARAVMEEAGRVIEAEGKEASGDSSGEPQAPRSPLVRLKQDLDKAIVDERYEDAARLRDRIQHLESSSHGN